MALVFLSHSSLDTPFVRQLAGELSARGIQVWFDEVSVRVGESIPGRIANGISSCDYFCLIISRASSVAPWVERELNAAIPRLVQRQVGVIPVILDDSERPALIADLKCADFRGEFAVGMRQLLGAFDQSELKSVTPAELWARYGRLTSIDFLRNERPASPPPLNQYLASPKEQRERLLDAALPEAYHSMMLPGHCDAMVEHHSFFRDVATRERDVDLNRLAEMVREELEYSLRDLI